MKTHYQNIFQTTSSLLLFAAFSGSLLSGDVAAQPGKEPRAATRSKKAPPTKTTPEKKDVTWYVSYTLTIKGNGEQKGEVQGAPDIKWWVDRSFVGRTRLDGPAPRYDGGKLVPGYEAYENYGPKASPWTVKVKIKDRLEKFFEGRGEIGTHEDRTDVTVWEADAVQSGGADNVSALLVNTEAKTYSVVLPLVPPSTERNVRMSRFSIIDRSAEGYGGLPTHQVSKPFEDQISTADIPMPRGEHLLGGRSTVFIVTKEKDDPLPPSYPYTIEFRKTCFHPREPFFESIEDSKTRVDICVEFLLSKIPH